MTAKIPLINPKTLGKIAKLRVEFSTKEMMGHSADRLAAAFGISRTEQVLC